MASAACLATHVEYSSAIAERLRTAEAGLLLRVQPHTPLVSTGVGGTLRLATGMRVDASQTVSLVPTKSLLMQTPDVSTPARAAAVAIEDMIRHKSMETGVLIDGLGKTFLKRSGLADRVRFSTAELLAAKGMTFTHNHPGGVGPSLEDLLLAAEFELLELRVVTTRYRYGVTMLGRVMLSQLAGGFATAEAGAIIAVKDDVRRGVVNYRDFEPEIRHRTLARLASHLGFNYWRQES